MAEFPALPLFTDAFISDTTHLNATQTGAYIMLLMAAWRSPDCRLPNDDKILARMARMDGRAWVANKAVILAFWKQDDLQKWYQRRLVDERNYVDDVRRKNADAGRASALKRKDRHATSVQPKVNVTATPTPTPTPTPKLTYGFEGKVIMLTVEEYQDWKREFSYIDLKFELSGLDAWFEGKTDKPSSWFAITKKILEKKNIEMKRKGGFRRTGNMQA